MNTYRVALSRSFFVTIDAQNEHDAKELFEFFVGNPKDLSKQEDRLTHHFNIQEIECVVNEAIDAKKL